MQPRPLTAASLGLGALAVAAWLVAGPRQAVLVLSGAALGFALHRSAFGFTAAWRRFLIAGESAGIRAQLVLLALTVTAFFPLLARGEVGGWGVQGFVFPAGVSVAVGAFLFGVGMQLGGGCGSGTLFTIGGGNVRMLVTLAFFVAGSLVATAHLPFWHGLPALPAMAAWETMGTWPALALHLTAFALLAGGAAAIERRARGQLAPIGERSAEGPWWQRPWSPLEGAMALAGLGLLTLLVAGRPWGITSAFALWGAKLALAMGIEVGRWPYWQGQEAALDGSLLLDTTSVMDLGLILGALASAALAGRFRPSGRLGPGELGTAILGGLPLGYGARLAWGCNIGAFLSGIGSGSLHGWLWIAAAIPGNYLGARLRPRLGLSRL